MNSDYYEHPMFDEIRFRIETKQLHQLKQAITQFVWTGGTGAAILGFTRAGKSTAIEMLSDGILGRDGRPIPIFTYSVHRRDRNTIRQLLKGILFKIGQHVSRVQDAEDLQNNLIQYIAELAFMASVKRVVLIIDEAQRLAIHQIDLFAEIYDRLREEHKISVTVFFVGNAEQMGRLLDTIRENAHEHIYGRYFKHVFQFHGLRNKSDVTYCLKQYDTLTYPVSGPTYTAFFLEEAVAHGFQLASLASSIWRVFQTNKAFSPNGEWAMEYFVRAINTLITDYLSVYDVDKYSDAMFQQCINVSGLKEGVIEIEEAQKDMA